MRKEMNNSAGATALGAPKLIALLACMGGCKAMLIAGVALPAKVSQSARNILIILGALGLFSSIACLVYLSSIALDGECKAAVAAQEVGREGTASSRPLAMDNIGAPAGYMGDACSSSWRDGADELREPFTL